jgi:RNA polymerase sigma-70 factor, ECF subfamily
VASLLPISSLFKAHAPYLWRVVRRLGVGEADADDLCQEAFVIAHRNHGSFRGESSERTWLYGICVRLVSDHRKRAHVRNEYAVATLPEVAVEAMQHEAAERRQARAMLDSALNRLDEERRTVFVLYEIEDMSLQEIATCLQLPLQTVYSRLKSARQELSNVFQAAFDVASPVSANAVEGR